MKPIIHFLAVLTFAAGVPFAIAADLETRNYSVGKFSEIENHTPGSIELIQGPETSVVAETEPEMFEHLEVNIKGDKLILSVKKERKSFFSWSNPFNNEPLHFTITTPSVNVIELNASGNLKSDAIKTESLKLSIHGSGNANIKQIESGDLGLGIYGSGKIVLGDVKVSSTESGIHGSGDISLENLESDSGRFSIHGSGNFHVGKLKADRLDTSIHGSGNMILPNVNVKDIEGSIHGSGNVRFGGRADTLNIRTHGSGNVSTDGFYADKIVIK